MFAAKATAVLLATIFAGGAYSFAADFQNAASRAIGSRHGSFVVINVKTGAVIASHNLNSAGRRVVRPGSAVKSFTSLALLASGALKPEETLVCRRKLEIAGHKLDCGHPDSVPLDAINALAYSCNDYFTTMSARLQPRALQDEFLRAGLANRPSFAPASAVGQIDLSSTREQLQLQAIGEQNIRVTPVALLAAYRGLALRRLNGDADAAQKIVLLGLDASTEYGMARLAQPPGPIKVAGKTGTAPADEGLWTHGWFVGFAPADRPEIALVVFLERGTGPSDAAPIASQIFSAYKYRSEH